MIFVTDFDGAASIPPLKISRPIHGADGIMIISRPEWADPFREHFNRRPAIHHEETNMIRTDARAEEIHQAEDALARLETAQYCAAMSNGRYYSDGSKAKDDADIAKAKAKLSELRKAVS